MIEKKKREAEDLFTDETAARVVASELGVKVSWKPLSFEVLIKDLVPGLNDVSVTGRIIIVYPLRTYTRHDLTEGRFARLFIADKSETLKVILWDDKTSLMQAGRIEQEQIIEVSHGYVVEGLDGKLELHVGSRGAVQINPQDVMEGKYPSVTRFVKNLKIAEIKEEGGPITVEGTVATTPIVREVVTSRNEEVAVASFDLSDETGKVMVSAWRRLAEVVKDLTVGTRIKMKNAYVRRSFRDRLELTSRTFTSIEIQTEQGT
jgi:replication factor A1